MSGTNRTVVRCRMNRYLTPLFSFDRLGIYVRCKDCRTQDAEGDIKRGTFHLVTWGELFSLMLTATQEFVKGATDVGPRDSSSGDSQPDEIKAGADGGGGCGDPGGQLVEPELQVPSTEGANS